jgi:folate-dependent phosphoribosylglycinamide formyltransferase PurN
MPKGPVALRTSRSTCSAKIEYLSGDVALAGYMQLLSAAFVQRFRNRIVPAPLVCG